MLLQILVCVCVCVCVFKHKLLCWHIQSDSYIGGTLWSATEITGYYMDAKVVFHVWRDMELWWECSIDLVRRVWPLPLTSPLPPPPIEESVDTYVDIHPKSAVDDYLFMADDQPGSLYASSDLLANRPDLKMWKCHALVGVWGKSLTYCMGGGEGRGGKTFKDRQNTLLISVFRLSLIAKFHSRPMHKRPHPMHNKRSHPMHNKRHVILIRCHFTNIWCFLLMG